MNSQQIKAQIAKLQAAGPDLPKAAAKRLKELLELQASETAAINAVTNFRTLEVGTVTAYGVAQKCAVCGETGAARKSKGLGGMTVIAHSLEAVATIADVRMAGNHWTEAGASGRYRLKDDYHTLAANGAPVVPIESKHKRTVPEISGGQPAKSKSKKSVTGGPVAEWRRIAAAKAWETIRAKRAAQQ